VQLNPGFIYVGNTSNTRKRAEHGNVFNIDDTAVPLIVTGGGLDSALNGLSISDPVFTTQVAPTVLADLGLDYRGLDGVRLEGTQFLPGLGLVAVPEPSTWAMLLTGLAGLGFMRVVPLRFRRRAVTPD
jgi:hypothetical protein